ncbi:hypothetical protein CBS101457_000144 [Exobasidium rhododendri]|nr:hypothetical protein CBS101457_000144 [Exobasidium rhododendri]
MTCYSLMLAVTALSVIYCLRLASSSPMDRWDRSVNDYSYDFDPNRSAQTPRLSRHRAPSAIAEPQTARPYISQDRHSGLSFPVRTRVDSDSIQSSQGDAPRRHRSRATQDYLNRRTSASHTPSTEDYPQQSSSQTRVRDAVEGNSLTEHLHSIAPDLYPSVDPVNLPRYRSPSPVMSRANYGATSHGTAYTHQGQHDLHSYDTGGAYSPFRERQSYGDASQTTPHYASSQSNYGLDSTFPEQYQTHGPDYAQPAFNFRDLDLSGSRQDQQNEGAQASIVSREYPSDHSHTQRLRKGREGKKKANDTAEGRAEKRYYFSLEKEDKARLAEVLHLYTGLLKENISVKCRKLITHDLAAALLSGDERLIYQARDQLYPPAQMKLLGIHIDQQWMARMSMEQSIEVVRKMARATSKKEEYVRNFFAKTQLDEAMAWRILHTPDEDCSMYAYPVGLDKPSERPTESVDGKRVSHVIEVWPWMKELEGKYFETVIEKLATANGRSESECADMLRLPHITNMFGKQVLHAGPEELHKIMMGYKLY